MFGVACVVGNSHIDSQQLSQLLLLLQMFKSHSGKRNISDHMGGGRGKQARTLDSSVNMVATPGFESMAGLRSPADRTAWY